MVALQWNVPPPLSYIPLKHSVQKTAICKHLKKPHFQEEEERSGKVGSLMETNSPADHGGGRRRGAEHADRIATIHSLEKILLKILIGAIRIMDIPTINNLETIVCIYTVLVIVGQLLIFKMARQDMNPRFRHTFARIFVVLGCVRCCLLMYIPLRVMPWPIFILRVLELMSP